MKKLVTVFLAGIMALSVTACGGGGAEDKDAKLKKEILDVTNEAYSGVTAADGSMYFLASTDGKFAVLVLEGKSENTYVRFIGSATNDNGVISVTDKDSGNRFNFKAEKQGDGYFLDCGNLGECYVAPAAKEDVVNYIFITFNDMKDVTAEFMAELGTPVQSAEEAPTEEAPAEDEGSGEDSADDSAGDEGAETEEETDGEAE